jgi:hypothetical protein
MMNRSLVCIHCGTKVGLETRTDPGGAGLAAHLTNAHRELVAPNDLPRWAVLFEHFRVVPLHYPSTPRIMQA